jgi:hypothetical protein
MALTIKQAVNAKPMDGNKHRRLSDGHGLYLLVKPSGAKSWVLRVQLNGKRTDYGLGAFTPDPINVDLPLERRSVDCHSGNLRLS